MMTVNYDMSQTVQGVSCQSVYIVSCARRTLIDFVTPLLLCTLHAWLISWFGYSQYEWLGFKYMFAIFIWAAGGGNFPWTRLAVCQCRPQGGGAAGSMHRGRPGPIFPCGPIYWSTTELLAWRNDVIIDIGQRCQGWLNVGTDWL